MGCDSIMSGGVDRFLNTVKAKKWPELELLTFNHFVSLISFA